MALDQKLEHMQASLRDLKSVAVAFSAGVDSTLVLKVALDTLGPENVVAVTAKSDSLASAEFDHACKLAEELGARHAILNTDEFDNPDYISNPTNRCYFCKTALYTHLDQFIADQGINAIVNGTNADDLGDYRPGLQAAHEHNVHAPAAEAGMSKADVRELSRRLGLPNFDKPASPCLSSRVPYGESITPEKLRMIESAEAFLRNEMGVRECRVRHHQGLARIEVPVESIVILAQPENAARLQRHLKSLGYQYVTLDLAGFRSGSMNEVITIGLADVPA